MNPISNTAFYCCGVGMKDAEAITPICGDMYTKMFMNEEALLIHEAFKDEVKPNVANVTRHRIIDDCLVRGSILALTGSRVVNGRS